MATDTAIVKFNIGGLRYEVSRSLLEMYSESMLTKIATDQWQEDPESEIFIERDGSTFRYVLNYLRDGKVKLPITETKSNVIEELVYYNIDHDANKIDDSNEYQANAFTTAKELINDLKSDDISLSFYCNEIAIHCLDMYMLNRVVSVTSEGIQRPFLQDDKLHVLIHKDSLHGGAAIYEHIKQLYKMGNHAQVSLTIQERVGIHLNKVGLAISAVSNHIPYFKCDISKLNLKKG
eukprot:scaffold667_cov304-Chaetoceros_neogracile.AAC.11